MSCLALMALAVTLAAPQAAPPARKHVAPIIPRDVLFGNPDRTRVRISPDGTHLGYLAARDGVLNVFVQDVKDGKLTGEPKAVTKSTSRPIRDWSFVPGASQVLYLRDEGGNENFQLFAVDLASGEEKCLTPWPGSRAEILDLDRDHPHEVLVSVNNRDPSVFDAWKIDTVSGKGEMVFQNDRGFLGVLPDGDWKIRFGSLMTPEGELESYCRDANGGDWKLFQKWPFEDSGTSNALGISRDGQSVFVVDSSRPEARNTGGLYEVTLAPRGTEQVWTMLATDQQCEPGTLLVNEATRRPQAMSFNYLKSRWKAIDPTIILDLAALQKMTDGEVVVTGRTDDAKLWSVAFINDNRPPEYYLYDATTKRANFLFTGRDALRSVGLAKMETPVIPARDGLPLVSYLTLPMGFQKGTSDPIPLVLLVHGGPWARDEWGYNPYHQWLANRGYAVLSVNFRGSTGFGKNFLNAGNRQWSKKMHDDLIDAVQWAITEKIADPKKVAIMGGSYGGYATLVGLTYTPDTFACGVDIVGPSNLATLLATIPPYWKPMKAMFDTRVGSLDEKDWLRQISPLTFVDNIQRPLLIGQGANDPRVKQAEADQIVQAMQAKKIPVTYVLFPDEGHGFARPENNMAFNAITEAFLAQHLGGLYEAMGSELEKSTAKIEAGKELVPGIGK